MKTWRMAFRVGPEGHEMWPDCFRLGVAAITYSSVAKVDLSKYPPNERKELWKGLESPQKYSLRQVADVMKKGDVIYAKQGSKIVGKGIIKGSYQFDAKFRIIDPDGRPWAHQVPVEWQPDFVEVRLKLGDQQTWAVRELSKDSLVRLKAETKATIQREALEGQTYIKEGTFRKRNAALIQAKKANSDYRCEVCGFSFEKAYGLIGRDFIIAHHIEPLSKRSRPSRTKLEDIALLCANCHEMVHTRNPPLSPAQLRKKISKRRNPFHF